MAKNDKYSYNEIPNLQEDWAHDTRNGKKYAGQSVQAFIKKYLTIASDNKAQKVGALYFDTQNMLLYTFRTSDDRQKFIENGDISLILSVENFIFPELKRS